MADSRDNFQYVFDTEQRQWVPMIGGAASGVSAESSNVVTKFREAFEAYDPIGTGKWIQSVAPGDLVYLDGNAAGASYLVVSKDPLSPGTETSIEIGAAGYFRLPVEVTFGAHFSQRTVGQEFSFEVVDTGSLIADIPDLAVSTITQTTTVLTVDTVAPHGLSVGRAIGIRDCSDVRMNYQAIVVATVTSPTQFTATAGPNGTIPSASYTNPAGAKGFVFIRQRMSRARNGFSMVCESASTTNASFYLRSESGDALPGGTIAGNHVNSVASLASVVSVSSPYTYSFQPSSEQRFLLQADRSVYTDAGSDSNAQPTQRYVRTIVCPDITEVYKFRIRAVSSKSLTTPGVQVVSVTKAGSTTATVVTAIPHNLVLGDSVTLYGQRNQTDYAATAGGVTVASVIDAVTFTVVYGTSVTSTTYGGFAARVQGGLFPSVLGAVTMAAQNATLSTLSDGTRQLVITGSAAWTGVVIGDLVNLIGVRNNTNGATIGIDGAWKVANIVSTVLTLVLPFAGSMALPADFGSTDCGGACVRRTDLRLSFLRIFDYERLRVEAMARAAGDMSTALPVVVQGGTLGTATNVTTVATVTNVTNAGTPTVPATPYFLNSAASTNGALILTGTSGVPALFATNIGATVAFVKLYNKATAPTVGTDVPEMIIPVAAAVGGVPGVAELSPGFNPYRFPLGLGIAITGAVADSDTTAVAAGQVKVKISRTV